MTLPVTTMPAAGAASFIVVGLRMYVNSSVLLDQHGVLSSRFGVLHPLSSPTQQNRRIFVYVSVSVCGSDRYPVEQQRT